MARLPKGQNFSVYSSPSFNFWYDEKWYTVQGAETMFRTGTKDDISTMRTEYTRMRDTAQKRLKRLEKVFPNSKVVENRPHGFPKLRDIHPSDFPKAFTELAKFLRAKGSTVTGQRQIKEKTINTWQKQGLNLNDKNYDRVIRILEEMRKQKIVYGSDKVLEAEEAMMELDDMQFYKWMDHLDTILQHTDELQEMKGSQNGFVEVDIDEFIKKLGW